ncbi:MAG: peptide deformylase [Clostridia bacterium]|nr:peptide deformylase [Clostridia bacterium]
MAVRIVLQTGNTLLRQKSQAVKNFSTPELEKLFNDLHDTLYAEDGAGLAAPQIGVLQRAVVIDADGNYYEMANPVIISTKGEQTGAEGCLSVKGKQGTVTRPMKVKVEYRDRNGRKHTLTAEGFTARAVCHELDHLEGILYTDIAKEVHDLTPEKTE